MSWSLGLRHGDLFLDGLHLGQARGTQKLVQDLRCAILERMGTDDLHPEFGSVIDGGRLANGTYIPSVIGSNRFDEAALSVESEIRRICRDYQNKQIDRSEGDRFKYGSPTLSPSELLLDVTRIDLTQAQDTLLVLVSIRTGDDNEATLEIPVTSSPIITR